MASPADPSNRFWARLITAFDNCSFCRWSFDRTVTFQLWLISARRSFFFSPKPFSSSSLELVCPSIKNFSTYCWEKRSVLRPFLISLYSSESLSASYRQLQRAREDRATKSTDGRVKRFISILSRTFNSWQAKTLHIITCWWFVSVCYNAVRSFSVDSSLF